MSQHYHCRDCNQVVESNGRRVTDYLGGANVPAIYSGPVTSVYLVCECCGSEDIDECTLCVECGQRQAQCDDHCVECMVEVTLRDNDFDPAARCWSSDSNWRRAAAIIIESIRARRAPTDETVNAINQFVRAMQ